mmetsp:Transcript_11617/g.38501  ORF Transcript_11617/g.38501 Transcript_11617/m.38501 type:complete len:474 (+) Transcript_11617:1901-3322(+)
MVSAAIVAELLVSKSSLRQSSSPGGGKEGGGRNRVFVLSVSTVLVITFSLFFRNDLDAFANSTAMSSASSCDMSGSSSSTESRVSTLERSADRSMCIHARTLARMPDTLLRRSSSSLSASSSVIVPATTAAQPTSKDSSPGAGAHANTSGSLSFCENRAFSVSCFFAVAAFFLSLKATVSCNSNSSSSAATYAEVRNRAKNFPASAEAPNIPRRLPSTSNSAGFSFLASAEAGIPAARASSAADTNDRSPAGCDVRQDTYATNSRAASTRVRSRGAEDHSKATCGGIMETSVSSESSVSSVSSVPAPRTCFFSRKSIASSSSSRVLITSATVRSPRDANTNSRNRSVSRQFTRISFTASVSPSASGPCVAPPALAIPFCETGMLSSSFPPPPASGSRESRSSLCVTCHPSGWSHAPSPPFALCVSVIKRSISMRFRVYPASDRWCVALMYARSPRASLSFSGLPMPTGDHALV